MYSTQYTQSEGQDIKYIKSSRNTVFETKHHPETYAETTPRVREGRGFYRIRSLVFT